MKSTLLLLNRIFKPHHEYFDEYEKSPSGALAYSMKSAQVVLGQFYGYNDIADKIVLDYGCGRGGKTIFYATKNARKVIGCDINPDYALALDYAKKNGLPVTFRSLSPAQGIDLEDDSIDVVISSSVLEHIIDFDHAVSEIRRVLKPGGLFLNRWHPFRSRNGAHLQEALGIPFAHLLFPEKAVMRAYCQELSKVNGRRSDFFKRLDLDTQTFNNRHCTLNFYTVKGMRKKIESLGFKLLSRRFLINKKEINFIRTVPEFLIDYLVDYEVQVWKRA